MRTTILKIIFIASSFFIVSTSIALAKLYRGSSIKYNAMIKDKAYARLMTKNIHIITPEYMLKWEPLRPSRHRFDFSKADRILNFAKKHGQKVRGHTLVWHESQPRWLNEGNFNPNELQAILKEHIETVISHYQNKYPGMIPVWDVINEPIDVDGTFRDTIWASIGEHKSDYIKLAFHMAHATDPGARLFYNEWGLEHDTTKAYATYEFIKSLKQAGVPIHGIGFQTHLRVDSYINLKEFKKWMLKYQDLGLEVHITEMDVAIKSDDGITQEELKEQAAIYKQVAQLCSEVPACTTFTTWGVTDKYTWYPNPWFPNHTAPLLYDKSLRPKPALNAILPFF